MVKNCSEMVLLTKSPYNGGLNAASQGLFRRADGLSQGLLLDGSALTSAGQGPCAAGSARLPSGSGRKWELVSQHSFAADCMQSSRAFFSRRSGSGK